MQVGACNPQSKQCGMKVHRTCLETARNTSFRHCSCFHIAIFHSCFSGVRNEDTSMQYTPSKKGWILLSQKQSLNLGYRKTHVKILPFCVNWPKQCILAIINFIHICQSLKVVGVCFLFSETRWQREKWPLPLINYILKYTWLWCPRVTCSGNLHAPNFTVPDSSICPIAGQTLLLCFYSLCIIQGLNTAQYDEGKYSDPYDSSDVFKISRSTARTWSTKMHFLIQLKYVGCKLVTQEHAALSLRVFRKS